MQSTLKTTLLATAAVLFAALGGAQAAQAGGHGYRHFNTYLLEGLHDEETYGYESHDRHGSDVDDAVSAATDVARDVLGVDLDDALDSYDE